jgi:hypothetical protein
MAIQDRQQIEDLTESTRLSVPRNRPRDGRREWNWTGLPTDRQVD